MTTPSWPKLSACCLPSPTISMLYPGGNSFSNASNWGMDALSTSEAIAKTTAQNTLSMAFSATRPFASFVSRILSCSQRPLGETPARLKNASNLP